MSKQSREQLKIVVEHHTVTQHSTDSMAYAINISGTQVRCDVDGCSWRFDWQTLRLLDAIGEFRERNPDLDDALFNVWREVWREVYGE